MRQNSPQPNSVDLPPETPLCILCVDDEDAILKTLTRVLRHEPFRVLTATSGEEGLTLLEQTENIGLILSDQRMPGMNGSDFLHAAANLRPHVPRMILTGYANMDAAIDAINLGGACRFLTKPWNDKELIMTVQDAVSRYHLTLENQRLTELVRKQNEELAEWNTNMKKRILQQTTQLREHNELNAARSAKVCQAVALAFTDILGYRNPHYTTHSETVAALADQITRSLGLGYRQCEAIRLAALLHDIGSLTLTDQLLSKKKIVMNAEELKELRAHSVRGEAAVDRVEELREVAQFIRHHHEAYDGSGYPDGLVGEKIPLGARIIALADWINNEYTLEKAPHAKYVIAKRLDRELGHMFDPALGPAAKSAIEQVLPDTPGRS